MQHVLILLLSGALPAVTGQQEAAPTVRVPSGVMSALSIDRPAPHLCEAGRGQHVNGAVVLHAIVGTDGRVQRTEWVSGPSVLREEAVRTISHWRYKPYLLNGKPVQVDTTITVSEQCGSSGEGPADARVSAGSNSSNAGTPRHVASGVMAGQILKKPLPAYPRYSREEHVSGATVLHVVIGRNGKVRDATVISGPPARTPYEIEAVRRWEYRPYLLHGESVEVETTVTLQPNFGS